MAKTKTKNRTPMTPSVTIDESAEAPAGPSVAPEARPMADSVVVEMVARPRQPPRSRSKRAGLQFPVSRFQNALKRGPYVDKIWWSGSVYMTAVVEYLIAEVLELAGNVAHGNRKRRITPRHVMIAVRNDLELSELMRDVTFPESGVLPNIDSLVRLPKKMKKKKKKKTMATQDHGSSSDFEAEL